MELEDWQNQKRQELKKPISRAVIDYVGLLVAGEDPPYGFKRVRVCEITEGTIVVWVINARRTVSLFIDYDGNVLERGAERWPRGKTGMYDDLCRMLEAEIKNRGVRRATDQFFGRHGLVANQPPPPKKTKRKVRRRRR